MTTQPLRFLQDEAKRLAEENRALREELSQLRDSVHALSALYYLSQNINRHTDVLGLLGQILDSALRVLKASDGTLMLVDETTQELVFAVVRGEAADRLHGFRLAPGTGIAGWVAQNRQPQIIMDARHDPRFFAQVDENLGFRTRSMVCVPIQLDDNRVLGVLQVLNKTSDWPFTQEDLDLLLVIAQLSATAMRRAERLMDSAPPPA